jgi:hypothetical protein
MKPFYDSRVAVAGSFMMLAAGGVMAIAGHVDSAILNVLVAIWFKMPYPEDMK